MKAKLIENTPTNIIMGFLGAGKTTAILDLLKQKPADEKWAVLVNEFGSVGIDGAIYASQRVAVKEVAGGCMCCVAGVSMQVAINSLLKNIRPQRLLIEPTGLGHPKKVLDILKGEGFSRSLDLKASICLLDPNKLKNTQYTEHENFIDQIAMCDVLVANKMDLADNESLQLFDKLAHSSNPSKQHIAKTQFGILKREWLDLEANLERQAVHCDHHLQGASDDGFQTVAWEFENQTIFDISMLKSSLERLKLERVKGVIKTSKGWFVINAQLGLVNIIAVDDNIFPQMSKIEVIHPLLDKQLLEQVLKSCKVAI